MSTQIHLTKIIAGFKVECELLDESTHNNETPAMDSFGLVESPGDDDEEDYEDVKVEAPADEKDPFRSVRSRATPDYTEIDADEKPPRKRRKTKQTGQGVDSSKKKKSVRAEKEKLRAPLEAQLKAMNLLQCRICMEDCDSFWSMKEHLETQHEMREGFVICCERRFDRRSIYDHMKYHLDKEAFKCDTCERMCMSQRELSQHQTTRHPPSESLTYSCAICGKGFRMASLLKAHMSKHVPNSDRGFNCPQCGKACATQSCLDLHVRTIHTKEMRHFCEMCGKGYCSEAAFRAHLKTHEVKATEACDICGKHFFYMLKHKQRAHQEVERVRCEICGKEYKKHLFSRHMRAFHSGQTSFKCTICEKEFRLHKNYQEHMNVHLGVKKDCYFCAYQVTNSGNLVKHLLQVHPVEYAQYKERKFTERRIKNPNGEGGA